MTTECAAIIVIILLVVGIMAREGKGGLALAVLPLTLTPAFYLISNFTANIINRWQTPDIYLFARSVVVVVGSLLACLIMGALAMHLHSKAARQFYFVLCGGFNLILTIIILAKIIP
jgi:hypothetical protein